MVFKFLVVLLFLLVPSTGRHDFYISVCYIKEINKQIEVTYRVFRDDAESALKKHPQDEVEFCDQISSYIKSNLQIREDNRILHLDLDSCSTEGNGKFATINCVLISEDHDMHASDLAIESTVLLDIYEDQVNMIHVQIQAVKKSMNLDRDRRMLEISLHQ